MILSVVKKLPFYRRYTTNQFKQWWAGRKIDWKNEYLKTWNHPHRYMISAVLATIPWKSLLEIGCGAGANLINILKHFQGRQLGGIDINPEAIAVAQKAFSGGQFRVNSADDIMFSDKATDVVLSDMCLIYVGPWQINKYIREIKRITRNYVVLCEFHSPSLWKRLNLLFHSGHHAYNYRKLLTKHGFYDIQVKKIPPDLWPGADDAQKFFSFIIIAKVPQRG